MATNYWRPRAADQRAIQTITIGGAWTSGDTHTVACNGKAVIVTVAGDDATTDVAAAIKEALMSSTRLDGTSTYGSTDATSNTGGQLFGEFAEFVATVSGSVVTLTGKHPGVPFVVSVVKSSTSGTTTLDDGVQDATGKNHWDNPANWSAGTVPANNEDVDFADTSVSCLFGFPNGSLEVTFVVHNSFTGQIGLPPINKTDPQKPYQEYRQRFVRLDDAGSGSNIMHRFGVGEGPGSPLINVRHSTVKCTPVVYSTGRPLESGASALNIVCTANTSELNVLAGWVDCSSADGATSAFAILRTAGETVAIAGLVATADVVVSGGSLLIGGTAALDNVGCYGGELTIENQSGTISVLYASAGVVRYNSTATITALTILQTGDFDARAAISTFAITATTLYAGGKYRDPYARANTTLTWIGPPDTSMFPPTGTIAFTAGSGGSGGGA